MLKAAETPPSHEPPESSIGELASQLVDDAKAYARAEVDVAKTIAGEKANAAKVPLILLVGSLFVALGALNALCVAIVLALASVLSPLLAGLVAFLLIGAVAAAMAWLGYSKIRDVL